VDTWNAAGAKQRIRDLAWARDWFHNWIDVVVVDGNPGEGVENATPWHPEQRQGLRWRIVWFDEETGHFRAELMR
jgi:hypothetical protein